MSVEWFFFFQAEDGIRDAQESRGLGDVYKRQGLVALLVVGILLLTQSRGGWIGAAAGLFALLALCCLLYTSDAADDLLCVDLGGRRIIKKKNIQTTIVVFLPTLTRYHFIFTSHFKLSSPLYHFSGSHII